MISFAHVPGAPALWLTHFPLRTVPAGVVNVHGHLHGHRFDSRNHINVSVEQLDYGPVELARIQRLAAALAAGVVPAGNTPAEWLRCA